jgi:metal-dependent amidase/aminoacylase/carboxypeptidase family protein
MAAGTASNIIAERAYLKGTSRTLSLDAQALTIKRLEEVRV